MLEEILKTINTNLERIANAMESKLNIGIDTGKQPDMSVPAVMSTNVEVQQPVQSIPVQTLMQTPVQTLMQTPVQAPMQTIPTTQITQGFTQEQLALAMSNAVSAGKMQVIQGIMQSLGVQTLSQVNPADYNKLASMLKEAGVEI